MEKLEDCRLLHSHRSLGLCQVDAPGYMGWQASQHRLDKSSSWQEGQRKTLGPSVASSAPTATW